MAAITASNARLLVLRPERRGVDLSPSFATLRIVELALALIAIVVVFTVLSIDALPVPKGIRADKDSDTH